MKEKDTARAIVKDLCQRDHITGEIAYQTKNKAVIEIELLTKKYCYEEEVPLLSPNKKKLKHKDRFKQTLEFIDPKVIDNTLDHVDGEVLNRTIQPCWWLNISQ